MKLNSLLMLMLMLIVSSCTTTSVKEEPSDVINDSGFYVLNGLMKINQAKETDWVKNTKRKIFKNQETGFIIKGEVCLLLNENVKSFALLPIEVKHPSATNYSKGTYWDLLESLNETNCKNTQYAYIDLNNSFSFKDINITIIKTKVSSPAAPTVPLFIPLESYAYLMGMNKGKYTNGEDWYKAGLKELVDHRIQPIKSWVTNYKSWDGGYSFKEHVVDYSPSKPNVPDNNLSLLNKDLISNNIKDAWVYVVDEPSNSVLNSIKTQLSEYKNYSNIKSMVTTYYREDVEIDIYCPVAEHLGHDGKPSIDKYKNKELWMYVSCMSNGCGVNRLWQSDPKKVYPDNYPRTGAPDVVIDAPSNDIFAFFALTKKFPTIKALLYYNSIEQWAYTKFGIDVKKDLHSFGGNGDGTLLYPNFDNKGVYPSLRLKLLREASYMRDAMEISKYNDLSSIESTIKWKFDLNIRDKVYESID